MPWTRRDSRGHDGMSANRSRSRLALAFGAAVVGMGVPVMGEAAQFGTGQVFLSMLWFFLFLIWICLLVVVFADIFRSHDLGGWGKALWTIFIIFLPYLGVFVYLIARGGKMQEHRVQDAQ